MCCTADCIVRVREKDRVCTRHHETGDKTLVFIMTRDQTSTAVRERLAIGACNTHKGFLAHNFWEKMLVISSTPIDYRLQLMRHQNNLRELAPTNLLCAAACTLCILNKELISFNWEQIKRPCEAAVVFSG